MGIWGPRIFLKLGLEEHVLFHHRALIWIFESKRNTRESKKGKFPKLPYFYLRTRMKIPPGNLEIPYGLWISCKIIWFTELESHSIMLLQFNLHSIFWLLPGPYFDFPILIPEILNPFLTPFFTWSSISLPTMISKNLGTILILFRENLRQSDFVGLRVLHLFLFFMLHQAFHSF